MVNAFKIEHGLLAAKLGLRIAQYRKNIKMEQIELAAKLGVTRNYISSVETGKKYPNLKVLYEIASIFNVSPGDLLQKDSIIDTINELAAQYNPNDVIIELKKHLKK